MNYVYYIYNNVKYLYNSMNPAHLSGAIDVIVVEQPDGTLLSTPFHVRFGKYGVFNYENKYVDIEINNEEIDLKMKLGENGVAFFVEKLADGDKLTVRAHLETSSLPDELMSGLESSDDEELRSESSDDEHHHHQMGGEEEDGGGGGAAQQPQQQPSTSVDGTDGAGDLTTTATSDLASSSAPAELDGTTTDLAGTSQQQQLAVDTGVDLLADGALSDSELEMQGTAQHRKAPEWKWGEIPKSTSTKKDVVRSVVDEEGSKGAKSRWNWFHWSRQQQQQVDGASETQTGENGGTATAGGKKREEEKGLYLQDLGSDPSKLERYFGKRSGAMSISSNASNIDSGNGVSLGTSPCNASSALCLNEESVDGHGLKAAQSMDNLTPTTEHASSSSAQPVPMPMTPNGDVKQQMENLKPEQRGRFDSGQSDSTNATDLNLSDDETTTVVAGAVLDEGRGRATVFKRKTKYKRSLRLSSDQLKLLNLDYGSNDARFSITTKLQGTAWCSCHIYLIRWDAKLVISDVDGTITKSDVLGHVIPAIGGTWAHSGVAELYTRIKNNGYQMVYLSSRAIGQSHYTKTYLQSIAQGSQTLPDGPVLLSPTSVLMAFRKEVIERRPEEFKIACLADLKSLFPVEQPFFAGFGNRETDVKSYQAVNIPLERILIIDPSGMLRRADKIGYVSDYATMALDTVDYIFPPFPLGGVGADPAVQMENSEFNTWRDKPKLFDHLVDEEVEAYEQRRKRLAEAEKRDKDAKKSAKKGGK